MQAPPFVAQPGSNDALPSIVDSTSIFNPSYGSFAHRAYRAVNGASLDPLNLLPTAEPVKVGVILPERYRIGNLVWRDTNNDGDVDQGEPGLNGIDVYLCRDDDGNAGPTVGDTQVAMTTTATIGGRLGKYRFSNLQRQSDYYVAIPDGQTPLAGLVVSTSNNGRDPNNDIDNDNNAQASAAPASCAGASAYVTSPNWIVGINSGLEPNNERTHTSSGNQDDDPMQGGGTDLWPDRMSNFSADFGFAAGSNNADLGDLPDSGNNTGTGNYRTVLADNGPSHLQTANLSLGLLWDAELEGVPSATALGDDLAFSDDEDGVVDVAQLQFFRGQPAQVQVRVVNDSGSTARLCSYVDWNADGDFSDTVNGVAEMAPTLTIPTGTGGTGSVVIANWGNAPYPGSTIDPTYARFRLSLDSGNCTTGFANGPSNSGEVEDYQAAVIAIDRGDLPDTTAATGVGDYQTLIANAGPSHTIRSTLRLGSENDADIEGQPNAAANGDDAAPGSQPDDEDGITTADLSLIAGAAETVRYTVTNTTGHPATVCGYIDFNGDGDFLDAGELATDSVATGANNASRSLSFNVPADAVSSSYARFRLFTAAANGGASCDPDGDLLDGEVEDYPVSVAAFDLGDLPDTANGVGTGNYQTLLSDSAARHPILPGFPTAPNLYMGTGVDAEADGQPNAGANGDDGVFSDDEDGVSPAELGLIVNIPATVNVSVTNNAGATARLCGFIDFTGDGDFADPGETASASIASGFSGSTALNFGPPLVGAASSTYARFRLSTDTGGNCTASGDASDGEVEDYVVSIAEPSDLGDLPDSGAGTASGNYETLRASNGARHPLRPGLRLGALVDDETDGFPSNATDGDDLDNSDDEDGIVIDDLGASNLVAGRAAAVRFNATNSTGVAARACAYIDFNGDGDFADSGEVAQTAVPDGSTDAALSFSFNVPTAGTVNNTFARFRLSTQAGACSGATANGVEPDGEVEDYQAAISIQDWGDLPDTAAGVASGDYQTLASDNGAVHPIVAGLRLGASVDPEGDGQPGTGANGDDNNQSGLPALDDEDGIDIGTLSFTAGIASDVALTATNTTGLPARVCGFIDFNRDGVFAGPEVQEVAVPDGSADAALALSFTAPVDTLFGEVFARFRLSTDVAGACASAGPASNGEVEDYVAFVGNVDLGDLPDASIGTGAGNYNTLRSDSGAEHQIVDGLFIGARVDHEVDGQPSVGADGDDNAAPLSPVVDDEDGVNPSDLVFIATTPGIVPVVVTNTQTTPAAANLCGYVDFNGDGDFLDAGESASAVVPDGSSNATVNLSFGTVLATSARSTYARFRLTTDACSPTGFASNGEVEDYPVTVRVFDLGDLPDSVAGVAANDYQTRLADGGARHEIVTGLFLGNQVDPEGDGQPSANARGDDMAGLDDEDGVTFQTPYELGSPARVTVRATNLTGTSALVCGYIDWNGDGDFADSNEFLSQAVPAGSNNASFLMNFGLAPIQAGLLPYARFRLSTHGVCSVTGEASDGEVEDYQIDTTGNGALELGDHVWHDRNNNCHFDPGEQGIAGVTVRLFLDSNHDGEPDAAAIDTTTTDGDGRYRFVDLLPDHYVVEIDRPGRYLGSSGSGWPYQPHGSCMNGVNPNDDADEDDNGFEMGDLTRSPSITLVAEDEPGPPNSDTNPTVDFGLVYNFDLALDKQLDPAQPANVVSGEIVDYVVTVRNEGAVPARNIWVRDRFPPGFAYVGDDWIEALDGRSATYMFAGPLLPGESLSVAIRLRALNGSGGTLYNDAEIIDADDDLGSDPVDIDSVPDNDTPPEDDQRGVPVLLPILQIPATDLWALALLAVLALGIGWRRRKLI
nr:GEVED domain-containing protein [Pseudomarimonas arenosa]